jgi:uncharacterized protein (TIGR02145 family)
MKQLLIFISVMCAMNISAQVTIGKLAEPHKAAVLDLSQKETSDPERGLLLPRVSLIDPDDFQLIASPTNDQKSKAAGMIVYNFSQCDGKFAQGVYTWTGSKWVQLTNNPVLNVTNPTLTFPAGLVADNYLVRIPSGQDARPAWPSAYAPEISYTNAGSVTGTWADNPNNTSTISGGLVFSSHELVPFFPATWNTSPISDISIWPDTMTTANVTANPFLSRESKLTVKGIANTAGPCPGGTDQIQEITLNQTNYAILAYNDANYNSLGTASNSVLLKNANSNNFIIMSNVGWKATITGATDIMDHTIPATGGTDSSPMGFLVSDYILTGKNTPNTKYKTATILLEDNTALKWAKDYTVTVMQCQGTPDMSSATNATNAETSQVPAPASWAGKVVKHAAKTNVYEEFYSADFGTAGRWMTTNLAAQAYDGISHLESRALIGPNANSEYAFNTAYWCYPNGGTDGSTVIDYNNNPHLGLLYTWDAATAGKGGTDGKGNTTNEGASDAYPDVQGICPQGWHLPSDYEWTELENAIIKSTTSYANVNSNIDPGNDTALLLQNDLTGYRGTTHGQAMKDFCSGNSSVPGGLSNHLANNGFSVLLAGYANGGSALSFGYTTSFWSCSSRGISGVSAWTRSLSGAYASVDRFGYNRSDLYSVRCKKD